MDGQTLETCSIHFEDCWSFAIMMTSNRCHMGTKITENFLLTLVNIILIFQYLNRLIIYLYIADIQCQRTILGTHVCINLQNVFVEFCVKKRVYKLKRKCFQIYTNMISILRMDRISTICPFMLKSFLYIKANN